MAQDAVHNIEGSASPAFNRTEAEAISIAITNHRIRMGQNRTKANTHQLVIAGDSQTTFWNSYLSTYLSWLFTDDNGVNKYVHPFLAGDTGETVAGLLASYPTEEEPLYDAAYLSKTFLIWTGTNTITTVSDLVQFKLDYDAIVQAALTTGFDKVIVVQIPARVFTTDNSAKVLLIDEANQWLVTNYASNPNVLTALLPTSFYEPLQSFHGGNTTAYEAGNAAIVADTTKYYNSPADQTHGSILMYTTAAQAVYDVYNPTIT
jgi:hypothetical protein